MLNRRHTLLGMGAMVALAATPVAASDGPLTVVATTGMIADAARQIGAAEVEGVLADGEVTCGLLAGEAAHGRESRERPVVRTLAGRQPLERLAQ